MLLVGPLLHRQARARLKELSALKKTRLHEHIDDWAFDGRFVRSVPPREAWPPQRLLSQLQSLGALERCTVISYGGRLEPWEASLPGTLETLLTTSRVTNDDGESTDHVIVVCRPGRLAFTQDGHLFRQIIHRR